MKSAPGLKSCAEQLCGDSWTDVLPELRTGKITAALVPEGNVVSTCVPLPDFVSLIVDAH